MRPLQVSRLDNLAGLAIKYNVTVADIKRANGLLSDTAMFAKDTLQIPTRSLSVGYALSTRCIIAVMHLWAKKIFARMASLLDWAYCSYNHLSPVP